ncbi:MAG: hypothetical protein KGH94_02875 [Candidatus Micrarchaeota archaeon]|nr:hypothetical protein [Candidatus Micrarchaeota archaeon]
MEYLMTYGWAILIIAVVLAALFSLNVFHPSLGNSCIGQPGYSCTSATITQQGVLTFTLGQGTGSTLYNVAFACTATSNAVFTPNSATYPFNAITSAGVVQAAQYSTTVAASNSLISTGQLTISGLGCGGPYTGTGSPGPLSPIGTSYSGTIWIAYSTSSTTGGTPLFARVATFTTASSS